MEEVIAREKKIVIGMCGLPGRGKTYIQRKLKRFLQWLGFKVRGFCIAHYRITHLGPDTDNGYFDPSNAEYAEARKKVTELTFADLVKYLKADGDIALLDGTHITVARRKEAMDYITKHLGDHTFVWVESICNDLNLIEENLAQLEKASHNVKKSEEERRLTYLKRIENYIKCYEQLSPTLDGGDISYIKLFDFGKEFQLHNVNGYLPSKIASYVINLHTVKRPIYFSRHGESQFNAENRVGGDSELTENGMKYANQLGEFLIREGEEGSLKGWDISKIKILASTLRRAQITASAIKIGCKPIFLKALEEINVGICDGLTYQEIGTKYPEIENERKCDKFHFRYPRGESYQDLVNRIEPVLYEIERSREPVFVVAHQGILRCLYAYFTKYDIEAIPHIEVPLHTVFRLVPEAYDVDEKRYTLDPKTGEWSCVINTIRKSSVENSPNPNFVKM